MKNILDKYFLKSSKYLNKLFLFTFLLYGIVKSITWVKTLDDYSGIIFLVLFSGSCLWYYRGINGKKIV